MHKSKIGVPYQMCLRDFKINVTPRRKNFKECLWRHAYIFFLGIHSYQMYISVQWTPAYLHISIYRFTFSQIFLWNITPTIYAENYWFVECFGTYRRYSKENATLDLKHYGAVLLDTLLVGVCITSQCRSAIHWSRCRLSIPLRVRIRRTKDTGFCSRTTMIPTTF